MPYVHALAVTVDRTNSPAATQLGPVGAAGPGRA